MLKSVLSEWTIPFATGNRLLYSEVTDAMDASEQMELMSDSAFSLFKKYMDYQIFDKEGNPLLEGNDDQDKRGIEVKYFLCSQNRI